jgi:hypothetical protein
MVISGYAANSSDPIDLGAKRYYVCGSGRFLWFHGDAPQAWWVGEFPERKPGRIGQSQVVRVAGPPSWL